MESTRPRPNRISYGPEPSQHYELWLPEAPRAAILLIHGGSWLSRYDLSHLNPLCEALVDQGYAVANLEYRRIGNPGGGWPGTFEDVGSGFAAAHSRLPGLPWVVLGHSAGGLLALHLGTTSRDMAAVVALAPLSCLQWPQQSSTTRESVGRLLGGTPEEIPEVYGAACPSGRTSLVPQCLLHGEADEAVPLEMSRHFCALRGLDPCPVTLLALPGVDHFQIIDPQSTAREPLFAALEKASRH